MTADTVMRYRPHVAYDEAMSLSNPTKPGRGAEVPRALDQQADLAERLREVVESLESRLEPVRRPEAELAGVQTSRGDDVAPASQVVLRIDSNSRRIDESLTRLRKLLGSLDL